MPQYFRINEDPYPIEWTAGVDRFLHLVEDELRAEFPSLTGRHSSTHPASETEPVFHSRFGVTGIGLESELCIVPVEDGACLFVRCEERVTTDLLSPWINAIIGALHRYGDDIPTVDWWAVIQPSTEGGRQPVLETEQRIQDLTLTPSSAPYTELVRPRIPQMGGGEIHQNWPVVVHGKAVAHSSELAHQVGVQQISRLCALASVATDYCWEILHAPQADPLDPESLPRHRVEPPFRYPEPDDGMPFRIDDWVDPGLELLANDAALAAAVQSHHQGMLMESRFPSFSVIAYTAAIETIGRRCAPPDAGTGKQFREALKLIRTSRARQALVRSYELRSQTAHAALLHGAEEAQGALTIGGWLPEVSEALVFRFGAVSELRQASRELLTMGGMGKIPATAEPGTCSREQPR